MIVRNFIIVLKRFTTSSILSIVGLAIAFAAFFVIIVQTYYDLSYDRNFKKADNIFLASIYSADRGWYKINPEEVQHIVTQFPEVKNFCRIKRDPDFDHSFDVEDPVNGSKHEFKEELAYISPSFIGMFTPEIITGDVHQMFISEENVLLTESAAKKFFGKEDPVGKIFFLHGQTAPLTVVAVCKDFPENCSLKNGIYLAHLQENDPDMYMLTSYIEMNPDDKSKVINKIHAIKQQNGEDPIYENLKLIALPDVHLTFPAEGQISRSTTLSLLAVGILLMIIAYINFINFAVAMAPARLKSFNIRKIHGEHPLFLKFSIAMETVFISFLAFLLSLLFIYYSNNGVVKEFLQADLSLANNSGLLLAFAGVSLITGFLVGMYPAFYSTHFKPVMSLSGSFAASPRTKTLKDVLIVIQFTAAIFLLITAGFIKIQHNYIQSRTGNWGGEGGRKENIILLKDVIYKINRHEVKSFENELRKNPAILDVTHSLYLTGDDMPVLTGYLEDKQLNYMIWIVEPNFFRFFDIDIIEGRDFMEDEEDKLIFNRTFLEKNSLDYTKDLFGKKIAVQGLGSVVMAEIVGISKDFNFQPLREPIKPIAFMKKQWVPANIYVKIISGNSNNAVNYINDTWSKFSNEPVNITFLDKWFDNLYEEENNLAKLVSIFGLITVIVAVMGVYGLILFNAKSKRKTIALHKINGASVWEVILMLNRGFIIQFVVAYAFAVPLAYIVVRRWLENFAYKTPVYLWVFIVGGLLVFLITALTVSYQSYKAATANPVEGIKTE
ncbi:MAG: ABC transporter permease [Tannerella sp.]|jgi:putative ABC transport system permease protein|nr:ABC transporter permease [Tannerella sp.]